MATRYLKVGRAISNYRVHENVLISIESGKITSFTANWDPKTQGDGEYRVDFDLSAYTVLPGFIDLHVHFGPEVQPEMEGVNYARLLESSNKKLIKSVVDARNMLLAGFTSARDCGGLRALALRDCINEGEILGPRLKCSGRGLTPTGGNEDARFLPVEWSNALNDIVQIADGADACRRTVRDQYRLNVDFIKIFVDYMHGENLYSPTEIDAVMDEAARLGLPVVVHAQGGDMLKHAVRASPLSLEHGTYLDEEACSLMNEHDVVYVPTMAFNRRFGEFTKHDPRVAGTPRLMRRMKSVRMAHEAGVTISTGSDYGLRSFTRHGKHNADEIILLVEAGLSNMEALMAATLNASKGLKMWGQIGALEPGYYADIIALKGNPLENIEVVKEVNFVMKEGSVVLDKTR